MERKFVRFLFAAGLSLMFVLICFGHDGRNVTKGRREPLGESAKRALVDQPLKLRYGKQVTVKDLKVKFDSVLDDSRCPKEVTCVWAGDAKILVSVRQANEQASKVELHTSSQLGQAGKYKRYVIKLVALDPYPRTSAKMKPGDYVATLLITRE